jgi:hypothetical protein
MWRLSWLATILLALFRAFTIDVVSRQGWGYLIEQVQNPGSPLDRLIKLEIEMGGILQDDTTGELVL